MPSIDRCKKYLNFVLFNLSLGYHSLPLKVCTAVETIGEIAAGGGSRGGAGVGRGELDGEEGRGLLTLLHEARTLLQVHRREEKISPPFCLS